MGLLVNIYRSDYDSEMNVFHGKKKIIVMNMEGPFTPKDDAPGAWLVKNPMGNPVIVPADDYESGVDGVQMNGGTMAHSCDSRFAEAVGIYGAIPIHDRRETWSENAMFNR